MEKEIRKIHDAKIEIRQEENEPLTLVGYAAIFNSPTEISTGFIEEIMPGAFTKVISENQDVRALIDHESGLKTIGRTTNGTLKLEQDNLGLKYTITLPQTTAGKDIYELVKRKDITGSSFAFSVEEDDWNEINDNIHRKIISIDKLYDISPVTYPAYEDTTVSVRNKITEIKNQKNETYKRIIRQKMAELK